MIDYRRLQTDLIALTLFGASLFLALSLVSFSPFDAPSGLVYPAPESIGNLCGPLGARVAYSLMETFGYSCYLLLAAVVLFDLNLFSDRPFKDAFLRGLGVALMMFAAATGLCLLLPGLGQTGLYGSGGRLGALGAIWLEENFSVAGTALILITLLLAGFVLAADQVAVAIARTLIHRGCWVPFVFIVTKFRPLKPTPEELAARAEADLHAPICDSVDDYSEAISKPLSELEEDQPIMKEIPINRPPEKKTGLLSASSATVLAPPTATQDEHDEPENTDDFVRELDAALHRPVNSAADADLDVDVDDVDKESDDDWEAAAKPVSAPVVSAAGAAVATAFRVNPPATSASARKPAPQKVTSVPSKPAAPFELPPWEILEDAEDFPYELLAKKAQIAAATLERTFQEFNLNVKVVEIDTGPVVTQFELELEPGLRVSKVTALADDLAIALRVPAVRIVSSIPGKNTVGVEVPNEKRVMVRLRELMEASQADNEKMRLPLFLGKDVSGHPMTVDLAKMPHLLIAGRTGTGKSVCLNTLILSLLMSRNPDQVKMLMIDPKMVELSPYTKIPHLMHPVITDMKKAEAVLQWAVDKMEERYDLLARTGVRHLESYNQMGHAQVLKKLGVVPGSEEASLIPEQMPYIVIIADEMADMIMTSGKDVEAHIIRLAQKSRAVGIHLVLATQKPTVDVITGLIKSNLPARIAFQVASRTDSRVVLDEMGAERLLGNGDMLYLAPGTSNLTRAQGTFVSDQEVNEVIEFLSQYEPEYSQEISQATSGSSGGGTHRGMEAIKERDELYEQAIDVVVREGRGSVSLLQRALGIGYGRGARLIDYMAEDGIVGDYNGSQAREVLFTPEQWAAFRNGESFDDFDEE